MQWTNKVKYQGQVKTAGIGKQMSWKTGFVDFDYDEIRDKWMVKLTFSVNPNRVFHQLQIGHSDSLAVKCGRLMIENKKGDGIHIKLSSADIDHARQLIAKIQRPATNVGHNNRAQVGIITSPSDNIKPHLNGSLSTDSSPQLSSNDVSPIQLENWLPMKTSSSGAHKHPAPTAQKQTVSMTRSTPTPPKPPPPTPPVSTKRRLEYSGVAISPSAKHHTHSKHVYDEADDLLDEIDPAPKRFTGMKAHPKSGRAQQVTSVMTPVSGTKRFYGSQNTVMKDKFPRDSNSATLAVDKSPRVKRPKLTSGLDSNQENCLLSNSPSLAGHNIKMASSGSADKDNSSAESDCAAQITVGFDNLGNTCFMNSPLQCLSSLEPLSIDFQTAVAEFGPKLRANSITRLLYLLMKDVRKLDVCPERVRQILVRLRHDINGKFALNTQQDAHELLAELLDRTDEEVKAVMGPQQSHSDSASGSAASTSGVSSASTPGVSSDSTSGVSSDSTSGVSSDSTSGVSSDSGTPIQSNFMWFYKTSFYFHECKTELASSQEERDTTLMLALNSDKDYSLQDCIDRYFESSEVEMKCDKCGRDEKATMTRKIVKRPRIFILNLLRYQTNITESKKKMDRVNIPRYMSIAEYCADDVKAPPYMEPVFMLDRICAEDGPHMDQTSPGDVMHSRELSFSEKDETNQHNSPPDEDCCRAAVVDKKAGDLTPQSHGPQLSRGRKVVLSIPANEQDTKRLVKSLISKFWEVENYIQEYGEDADMLYVETSAIISEVNSKIERERKVTESWSDGSNTTTNHSPAHQVAVCQLLMNLALRPDEDDLDTALDDEHFERICTEIFLTRYTSYDKEDKKREHLIENLGLYLAAKKLGIAKPDTPKKTMRSSTAAEADGRKDEGQGQWGDKTLADVDSAINSPGSDDEISFKSHPKDSDGGGREDKKRTVEQSQDQNPEESFGNPIITLTSVLPQQRDDSPATSILSTISTSQHIQCVQSQQEHRYFGSANVPNFNLIQDRDFSGYTEGELQSVDLASLTDDEMMQYAQALSKFQYVRDQKAKPDDGCPMELCDLTQDEAMSPNISDLANECDHLSQVLQCASSPAHSPSGGKPTTVKNPSGRHTGVLHGGVFSDACVPNLKGTPSTQGNEKSKEIQLTCEENLSDLDEPDGLSQIDMSLIKDYKSENVLKSDIKTTTKCHSTPAGDDYFYDYSILNQADFDSQPMDMNMSFPESHSLFCDPPSEAKTEGPSPKVLLDTCNTSPLENGKSLKIIGGLDANLGETVLKSSTKCSPSSSSQTEKLPKVRLDGANDHVVPSSSHPSPRKDSYLFSPSKPTNLTKTRDYSRLRSPSASPRKRNNRTQSRSSSATKKLLFPADEKGGKSSTSAELGESFLDFPKNSFLEGNIDDNLTMDRGEDCVLTPTSVETSRPTAFSPTIRKNDSQGRSGLSKPAGKLEPLAAPLPLVESVHTDTTHAKPDTVPDSHQHPVTYARLEKLVTNEKLQENTNSERCQATGKSRTARSGCFSSTEEKENDPVDLARNKRLENIELGKADFSYRLVGIVNHHGESLYAGHYTAFAYNLSKQKWFYMDDRHTKETTELTARRDSLNSGYVFFYMDKELFHEYAEKVGGETTTSKFQ